MSTQRVTFLTPEQYLEIEREAEFRSEYLNGEVVAMSGGTPNHARIALNTAMRLAEQLAGHRCEAFGGDLLRLYSIEHKVFTYPDVLVTCGPHQFLDARGDTITDATVIVEVLSPSTEAHDRGFKFAQYQQLDSLEEYVLVSQIEPRVESFRRQMNGKWLYSDVRGIAAICRFDSVDCEVPLSEIYYQVAFDSEPPLPRV